MFNEYSFNIYHFQIRLSSFFIEICLYSVKVRPFVPNALYKIALPD